MTHKLRWLAVAGLMALLSAGAIACGTTTTTPQEQWTYCTYPPGEEPTCEDENLVCDPHDGICKCGGVGGPICHEGETCVIEPGEAAYCVSDRCSLVQCTDGLSCDPADGECKCGGETCGDGERCLDNQCVSQGLCSGVHCAPSETCDPTDGFCKCGGEQCGVGSICIEGTCQTDPCLGVNCGTNLYCNPNDGLCHCGSEDGELCATGSACVDAGEGFVCEGPRLCENVDCPSGTTCDPDDGLCHCGGIGPDSPVCDEGMMCNPATKTCIFGNQCENVECEDGLTCNPENGECTCGGVFGIDCAEGELCVSVGGMPACAAPCNPIGQEGQNPHPCGQGWGCYVDDKNPERGGFCAPLPTSAKGKDQACTASTECGMGMHCIKPVNGSETVCKPYCDSSDTQSCGAGNFCAGIPNAPDGLGYCFSF